MKIKSFACYQKFICRHDILITALLPYFVSFLGWFLFLELLVVMMVFFITLYLNQLKTDKQSILKVRFLPVSPYYEDILVVLLNQKYPPRILRSYFGETLYIQRLKVLLYWTISHGQSTHPAWQGMWIVHGILRSDYFLPPNIEAWCGVCLHQSLVFWCGAQCFSSKHCCIAHRQGENKLYKKFQEKRKYSQ